MPTAEHFAVASRLLELGLHVLVEKPIAATLDEADALIALAAARGRVLQVGHLERFNAGLVALADVLRAPLFIESHRLAPFQPRGTDVDVVLDLMIHDIDLIQQLVGRPLIGVEAVGVPVLSARLDIANARLSFEGGCVANVTASRASLKSERRMRLFQKDAYVSIDFQAGAATIARKGAGEMFPGVPDIKLERRDFAAQRQPEARDRGLPGGDPRRAEGRGLGRGRKAGARYRAADHSARFGSHAERRATGLRKAGRRRLAVDPGQDVVPHHLALQVAQQQVPALGVDDLEAGIGGQPLQHRRVRVRRHDLVARAAQDQERPRYQGRRGERQVHQPHEAGDRVDPRSP